MFGFEPKQCLMVLGAIQLALSVPTVWTCLNRKGHLFCFVVYLSAPALHELVVFFKEALGVSDSNYYTLFDTVSC